MKKGFSSNALVLLIPILFVGISFVTFLTGVETADALIRERCTLEDKTCPEDYHCSIRVDLGETEGWCRKDARPGICGTANEKVYPFSQITWGTDTFCLQGEVEPSSVMFPLHGESVEWLCKGENGASDTTCSASKEAGPSYQYGDVVLNEIMWAGSSVKWDDEWIELRNMTDTPIDLSFWTLVKFATDGSEKTMVTIPYGKTIPANGFFLISNYSHTSPYSTLNVSPDLVDSGLALRDTAPSKIKIYDPRGQRIDVAGNGNSPFAGSNGLIKASMARKFFPDDGKIADNWFTHQLSFGFDAGATELGSPGNSSSTFANAFPETVYEDAENGNTEDWSIYANPSNVGGVINKIDHSGKAIDLIGNPERADHGFKFGTNWANSKQFIAYWNWKTPTISNSIYFRLQTNKGWRLVLYLPKEKNCNERVGDNRFIECGLSSIIDDGNWYTYVRDLQADISIAQPGTTILNVQGIYVRGASTMDNIKLLTNADSFYSLSGNVKKDGSNVNNAFINFGTDAPYPVVSNSLGNYENFGFTNGTYQVNATLGGTDFISNPQTVLFNGSNLTNVNFIGISGSPTVYEDGNDASDWSIYDNNPTGTISVATGQGPSGGNALNLSGTAPLPSGETDPNDNGTGFMMNNDWVNNSQFTASWDMNTTDDFSVYFEVVTSIATHFIQYTNFEAPGTCRSGNNNTHVICGISATMKDGSWHTLTRNLLTDYQLINPGATINKVVRIRVRGNMLIDNVSLQ